ncbi:hypothetical protein Ahy_A04g019903 isoform E [Arachis hypogaea]|uniref:Uncharacterized protein n=1 Tax=Arachis hypogaea TaxID=3818 RepID=A0A445DGP6_ARAHY|nr:hypothetical protein Ahy_A04g019903 isoform E [Arachis hypogaea]
MNPVVLLLLEMPKPLPLSIAAGIAKNPYCLGCQCCSILPSPATNHYRIYSVSPSLPGTTNAAIIFVNTATIPVTLKLSLLLLIQNKRAYRARRPQPPQSLPPLQPRSPRISPRSSPQPPQPRSPTAAQPPQPLHRQSLHRHRRRSVAVIGSCVAMIGSSLAVVSALNEARPGSVKSVFKAWEERLNSSGRHPHHSSTASLATILSILTLKNDFKQNPTISERLRAIYELRWEIEPLDLSFVSGIFSFSRL